MKRSLIWRFAIIAVVLVGWLVSIFPLHDRDFLEVAQAKAKPRLEQYRRSRDRAEDQLAAARQQLAELSEGTPAHREQQQRVNELQKEAAENAQLLNDWQRIIDQAQTMQEEEGIAAYIALQRAARGDDRYRHVNLYKYIPILLQDKPSNNLVLSYIYRASSGKLRLGLDLKGGTEFIIGFNPEQVPAGESAANIQNQVMQILRNRVDQFGVVEPEIKRIGDTSISIRMPLVKENEKARYRADLTAAARLTFHLVHENNDEQLRRFQENPQLFTTPVGYIRVNMDSERHGEIISETLFIRSDSETLEGSDIENARAMVNEFGNYSISLTLSGDGARKFSGITGANVGRRLAIRLDDTVHSAPVIRGRIDGGRAEISGSFTPEEAQRLAGIIESGNLPVDINIDSEFGTDPSLGADSIRSGIIATVGGLLLVVLFMLWYYRFAGVVAVLALTANLVLVLGTLTLLGATVTLPGIAGIILTIGMAVDANVLIFERIREERASGKGIANAIEAGYGRAFITIIDSNLTTLITAFILFKVGTGAIRGFAVTLSIGILASMFTALYMTRTIFDYMLYSNKLKKLTMMSIVKKPNINFLGYRKIAWAVSAVLLLISLIAASVRGRDALGIDFAGGTTVTYRIIDGSEPPTQAVEAALTAATITQARVGYKFNSAEGERLLEITLPDSVGESAVDLDAIESVLNAAELNASFSQVQTTSVGQLIGRQFQRRAILSAIMAAIAIVIYVSFRFELAYGIASVIALFHDVLIAAGLYILFGRQLSLPVVAALLTIMGYSLNDTIVVFDRIREDLSLGKNQTYQEIINLSINQTLSRTLLTSLTTLLVVITLFLFGGGAINDFALVMLIGVIVGTYSSIFVASTIVAFWHKRANRNILEEDTKVVAQSNS